MSNSMQSHFNKEDDDEDEVKEFKTSYDAADGTVTITTTHGAADSLNIPNTVMRWDAAVGDTVFEPMNSELNEIKQQFQEYKDQMNARIKEMEDQVLLVRRDVLLEEDFEELKEAWEAYDELLKKLRTFKALKDSA